MVCLFVCVVDRGENEGEPTNEQYCEQVNEDQFREDRTSPKATKTASSIPSFDACFCLSFINTNYWPAL